MLDEPLLLRLIVVGLVLGLGWPLLRRWGLRAPMTRRPDALLSWGDGLRWIATHREGWARLAWTLAMIGVAQGLQRLVLPYIDVAGIDAAMGLGLGSVGSDYRQSFSVATLGLMPFFHACLLIQWAGVVIPALRRWALGSDVRRYRCLVRVTVLLTLVLTIVEAYGMAQSMNVAGMVTEPGWRFALVTTLTIAGGSVLLILLAELINHYGLGNGYAALVGSRILVQMVTTVLRVFRDGVTASGLATIAVLLLLLLAISWLVRQAWTISCRATTEATTCAVPLRVTAVGMIPLSVTQQLLLLPMTLAIFIEWPWLMDLGVVLAQGTTHLAGTAVGILLMAWLYQAVVVRRSDLQRLLADAGYAADATQLCAARRWTWLVTAAVLSVIALLPRVVAPLGSYLQPALLNLWGLGLLMVVGWGIDVQRQLSFLQARSQADTHDWILAAHTVGELEAELLRAQYAQRGIPALIETKTFPWGMPERTIVDSYRVYIPRPQ